MNKFKESMRNKVLDMYSGGEGVVGGAWSPADPGTKQKRAVAMATALSGWHQNKGHVSAKVTAQTQMNCRWRFWFIQIGSIPYPAIVSGLQRGRRYF